ncbi:MAG: DUF2179 domain-containing protein [Desulfobacterales bacterium]|uniref:DUF2179 domain-containing protein n=1 Tax=Candidatus Desulfatibia vada TaxID=2841696 RepID=A0A8J6P429_9BACT|nr:DUF2179 domain-containing protein [Candidatus Desulfatibia vada]MBL6971702.1 DUF2179 domain-containing protein [Desulfobacterales bacterium]
MVLAMFDLHTIVTGFIVFFARICDVSIGTVRMITTVQGRTGIAFILAVFEIIIWISVASVVIHQVREKPILIFFYAFGYATGNVVGIITEKKLAFGLINFRVITKTKSKTMTERIRKMGQPVTMFQGEGMTGPVYELYIVCRRRDLKKLIPIIKEEDPDAFYITEHAMDISKALPPIYQPATGWRAVMKRK